jgi:P-type E1-E2 ATPase
MDSLRSLSSPTALVIRGGEPKYIAARHVVPGDIVMIKPGDVVPADIRLFSVANLEMDEALLTGEALPVAKTTDTLASRSPAPTEISSPSGLVIVLILSTPPPMSARVAVVVSSLLLVWELKLALLLWP